MKQVYLAQPYTHDAPEIMNFRYNTACVYAAQLYEIGFDVRAPVVHCHPISLQMGVGKQQDKYFWYEVTERWLAQCDAMIILMLLEWEQSVGIKREWNFAARHDIPVYFLYPTKKPPEDINDFITRSASQLTRYDVRGWLSTVSGIPRTEGFRSPSSYSDSKSYEEKEEVCEG